MYSTGRMRILQYKRLPGPVHRAILGIKSFVAVIDDMYLF